MRTLPAPHLQEKKLFDDKFARMDTRKLCELTSAADALKLRSIVDLSSKALARCWAQHTLQSFHLDTPMLPQGRAASACPAQMPSPTCHLPAQTSPAPSGPIRPARMLQRTSPTAPLPRPPPAG